MNEDFAAALAIAAIWTACAMAIIAGLYFTRSIHCLWFMLIPALINVRTGGKK